MGSDRCQFGTLDAVLGSGFLAEMYARRVSWAVRLGLGTRSQLHALPSTVGRAHVRSG